MNKKITVIGAGNVGATTAQRLFEKNYNEIALIDIAEGMAEGKALDILQSGPILGLDNNITGSTNYDITKDSDIIVITSGIARKPGMSRDDLLLTNMKIVSDVVEKTTSKSPNSILVIVTNPLDAMAQQALKVSGFAKEKVVGMAGVLDTARYRSFLAEELNVSVDVVQAYVLGGHGDTMVPTVGPTTVGGIPVADLIPANRLEEIVQRTRDGGAEIVGLLKTGSAYYAPSASIVEMIDSIILDKKLVLPCTAYLEGEYGLDGLYVGVPVKLGKSGIEHIYEFKLTDSELKSLHKSAESVKELLKVMEGN